MSRKNVPFDNPQLRIINWIVFFTLIGLGFGIVFGIMIEGCVANVASKIPEATTSYTVSSADTSETSASDETAETITAISADFYYIGQVGTVLDSPDSLAWSSCEDFGSGNSVLLDSTKTYMINGFHYINSNTGTPLSDSGSGEYWPPAESIWISYRIDNTHEGVTVMLHLCEFDSENHVPLNDMGWIESKYFIPLS